MARMWAYLGKGAGADLHSDSAYRSSLITECENSTVSAALARAAFKLSGRRSPVTVGAQVASGRQPRGRALPQLVPDLLGPEAHLSVALAVQHPLLRPPQLFPPVEYAIHSQHSNPDKVNEQRREMMEALCALADAMAAEALFLSEVAPEPTRRVLMAGGPLKNITFVRDFLCCG